jgi:Uma2 family endonuclease
MTSAPRVPILCAGDTLTRDEFERRYELMPDVKKAELLEGVVFMPSPVRDTHHGRPHALLAHWLTAYEELTPGVACSVDSSLRLDMDNEPQPDLMLRITGMHCSSRIDADGYVQGPPELVVEVAASSVSIDLHHKLHVYRRSGVREYLVLRIDDAAVDWFVQRRGSYEQQAPAADGFLHSEVFPGLWLDAAALLRQDVATLRAAVVAGTATAEHAAFVQRLRD